MLMHKSLKNEITEVRQAVQSVAYKQELLEMEKNTFKTLRAVKPKSPNVDVKIAEFEAVLTMLKKTVNEHAKDLRLLLKDQKSMQVDFLKAEEIMKSNRSSVDSILSGERNLRSRNESSIKPPRKQAKTTLKKKQNTVRHSIEQQ